MKGIRNILLSALIGAALACGSDSRGGCGGEVESTSQTGKLVTASGSYFGGQPVIRLTKGGEVTEVAADTYNGDTATFNLTGVPAGTYTVKFYMSCDDNSSPQDLVSSITQITIT